MPRFRLEIEYQGTQYSGWQIQKNARTVQGEIRAAIGRATGLSEFEFQGAGRTDAGVHALRQVAHLDIHSEIAPETLRFKLNDELPSDIHVLRVAKAPPRFHARHHAISRSYLYQISRRRSAFGKKLTWWIKDRLDIERMRAAAALFTGMKDCRSFSADDPETKSSKVLIDRIQIREAGDLILIRVEGSHFLWKMVRRIVGVIVETGKGNLETAEISKMFETRSDLPARVAAPASGLFLERIYYEDDAKIECIEPLLNL